MKYIVFVVVVFFVFACRKIDREENRMNDRKKTSALIMTQRDLYLEPDDTGQKIGVCDQESILPKLGEIFKKKNEGGYQTFERVVCNGKEGYVRALPAETYYGSKEELLAGLDRIRAHYHFLKDVRGEAEGYEQGTTYVGISDNRASQKISLGIASSAGRLQPVWIQFIPSMTDANSFHLITEGSDLTIIKRGHNIIFDVKKTDRQEIRGLHGKEFVPSHQPPLGT